jgi:nucleoside-diphosphate-sugar epimerase
MRQIRTSKICGEKTARTFARRFKSDIYALRIGNVIEPHEYVRDFPVFIENPTSRKRMCGVILMRGT